MSTEEENKAKERRVVEEAINNGNFAVLDEVLSPDFVYQLGYFYQQ